MFHMDLLRNCENTPTVRICDPVKNESITSWLDETKRKKREAEDDAKRQLEEYRNKKKQKKTSMVGNLNSFIVKAKKAEVPKKAMEMESEKQGKEKEKEAKRESIDDILNTMPRAQIVQDLLVFCNVPE